MTGGLGDLAADLAFMKFETPHALSRVPPPEHSSMFTRILESKLEAEPEKTVTPLLTGLIAHKVFTSISAQLCISFNLAVWAYVVLMHKKLFYEIGSVKIVKTVL